MRAAKEQKERAEACDDNGDMDGVRRHMKEVRRLLPEGRPQAYTWWGEAGAKEGVFGAARGREAGYSITRGHALSRELRADPLLAMFLRYDVIESGAGGGLRLADGTRVQL